MTTEITTYTDSAMADKIKIFFNKYKVEKSYKYIEMIDTRIFQSQVIEIDYNDFTDDVKQMLAEQSKERIHKSIYRAIGEVFQTRRGSAELESVKQEDILKFRLSNCNIFDDKVCSNPKLIHYEDYDIANFEGEKKITNVAIEIQKYNTFVTDNKSHEILLHTGKIYDNLQAESLIIEETEKLIPNCTKNSRNEAIAKIKAQTFKDLSEFDTNPNETTIENGILELDTQDVRPHTPKNNSRVLLPVEFTKPKYKIHSDTIFEDIEKNLKDTLFWKYLKASFTVDGRFRRNDFETVLEIIASVIVKRHIDEKAFMFLGGGENGKSICLGYIHSMLGKRNVSSITLQDIAEDKFLRANLMGKSANIFPDLEENELKRTGKIKAITSNEGIEVQFKYGQPFTLYPFCKLMFSCNRFPKSFDQSQGFFRRWMIVKWERNFENDPERIEYLREKLQDNQEEKNKVFSCLVYLANKLNQVGKFTHSKDWQTIRKEWNANADPIDSFDTDYIIDSDENKTKRETYQFYKTIMIQKGETPLTIGKFGRQFVEYHDEDRVEIGGRTQRAWLNIDFRLPIQTTLKKKSNFHSK